MGPAAGIMALPAGALRLESRNVGMGVYYTRYYARVALLPLLPGIAGWSRDASGLALAPLFFASALLLAAICSMFLFRRMEAQPVAK